MTSKLYVGFRDSDKHLSRYICSAGPSQINCQKAGMKWNSSYASNQRGQLRAFQAWTKLEVDRSQSLITEAVLKLDIQAKKVESENTPVYKLQERVQGPTCHSLLFLVASSQSPSVAHISSKSKDMHSREVLMPQRHATGLFLYRDSGRHAVCITWTKSENMLFFQTDSLPLSLYSLWRKMKIVATWWHGETTYRLSQHVGGKRWGMEEETWETPGLQANCPWFAIVTDRSDGMDRRQ